MCLGILSMCDLCFCTCPSHSCSCPCCAWWWFPGQSQRHPGRSKTHQEMSTDSEGSASEVIQYMTTKPKQRVTETRPPRAAHFPGQPRLRASPCHPSLAACLPALQRLAPPWHLPAPPLPVLPAAVSLPLPPRFPRSHQMRTSPTGQQGFTAALRAQHACVKLLMSNATHFIFGRAAPRLGVPASVARPGCTRVAFPGSPRCRRHSRRCVIAKGQHLPCAGVPDGLQQRLQCLLPKALQRFAFALQ